MNLKNDELVDLIDRYCDGDISPESFEYLQGVLKSDEESRKFYIRYLNVRQGANSVRIPEQATVKNGGAQIPNQRSILTPLVFVPVLGIVVAAAFMTWLNWERSSFEAQEQHAAVPVNRTDDVTYVGEIVNISSDVIWARESSVNDFLCRVSEGDRIEILSGLVQVDYYGGASLIIRAPSAFVITGPQAGKLEQGELTGMVTEGDFTLMTPDAKVLDLGTEFGVVVDHLMNTDVCVIEGKVEVSTVKQPNSPGSTLLLSKGMAARVNKSGIAKLDSAIKARFTRKMKASRPSNGEVSLLDVFADHDPESQSLGQAVSPTTGLSLEKSLLGSRGLVQPTSEDVYQQATWHPLLDGVFIPNAAGQDVQSDSSGTRIQLPRNEGRTSAPVWTRRKTGTPKFIFNRHFWGGETRKSVLRCLENSKQGLMGLHSNVGVTFDLNAIEKRYGKRATSFRSLVANLDNKEDWEPSRTDPSVADIRMFVDGELVASRLSFAKSDGNKSVEVSLSTRSRFLTIVTTDCGTISYDQVVLIDPVIEFD